MKKLLNAALRNRYTTTLSFTISSVVFSALLSAFLLLLAGGSFTRVALICFLLFCGWAPVSFLLAVVTRLPDDLLFGFGAGLYYGTAGAALFIGKVLYVSSDDAVVLGFVIAALVCTIVYLAGYKCKNNR